MIMIFLQGFNIDVVTPIATTIGRTRRMKNCGADIMKPRDAVIPAIIVKTMITIIDTVKGDGDSLTT